MPKRFVHYGSSFGVWAFALGVAYFEMKKKRKQNKIKNEDKNRKK